MQEFQFQGRTFVIERNGHVSMRTANGGLVPVANTVAQRIKAAFQQQQQQQQPQQVPQAPTNPQDAAREKIAEARREYGMLLKNLREQRANLTKQQYDERFQEIKEDLDQVIGMIRETHGIGQRRQNQQLTADQIDRTLASTPIPGEPKKKQFSNTAYHPQRNIYA